MRGDQELTMRWVVALALVGCGSGSSIDAGTPWTVERAHAWYAEQPWLVGVNFAPSTAVNQLEMWQAETFDEQTIDRELGWAAAAGFNTVRVFLHDIPWRQDPVAFLARIDRFLARADAHGIRTMLVLFDGVWDPLPQPGPQLAPRPYVHNSRWVQSPGADILGDPARIDELEDYVTGVVGRFANDRRVVIWDIYNEADNPNVNYAAMDLALDDKSAAALVLMQKAYGWARSVAPTQPLTSGVFFGGWGGASELLPINDFMLHHSDIVSFHAYFDAGTTRALVGDLRQYGRPVICTEYMARSMDSTFGSVLPMLAEQRVGAYSWGLVDGKTQTKYPWSSWTRLVEGEPAPWFHDVLRADGTPYDAAEVDLVRSLAGH